MKNREKDKEVISKEGEFTIRLEDDILDSLQKLIDKRKGKISIGSANRLDSEIEKLRAENEALWAFVDAVLVEAYDEVR